jgi:hypothetical protein
MVRSYLIGRSSDLNFKFDSLEMLLNVRLTSIYSFKGSQRLWKKHKLKQTKEDQKAERSCQSRSW